jgi:hypothetical protein
MTTEYATPARSYFRGLGWTPACIDLAADVVIDAASPAAAELLKRGIATKGYRAALAEQLADHADACDWC